MPKIRDKENIKAASRCPFNGTFAAFFGLLGYENHYKSKMTTFIKAKLKIRWSNEH